jgi:hypothetical protein
MSCQLLSLAQNIVMVHDKNSRPLLDQLEETMASIEKLRLLLQSTLDERYSSLSIA